MELENMTQRFNKMPQIRTKDVVERLKEQAEVSPVFKAMAVVFASRERTRQQVSIQSLEVKMNAAGYNFSKEEYERELEFLGGLSLGSVKKNAKGHVVCLKGISITLQSIGAAALGKKTVLNRYTQRTPYTKLPATGVRLDLPILTPPTPSINKKQEVTKPKEVTMTIKTGYVTHIFELFPEDEINQVLEVISKIHKNRGGK